MKPISDQDLADDIMVCSAMAGLYPEHHWEELVSALTELQELRLARFAPLGDNHHNANMCPYCNPNRKESS